jgi:transcriptional regulator with XRE-family HTH domain
MATLSLTRSELARALAILRVSRGWSQQEVAEASGLSAALVSLAENKSALPPSTHSLELMVEAMGFPVATLSRVRDFLRELDSEMRDEDARRDDPAAWRSPGLSLEAGERDERDDDLPFPGLRTTNWFGPRWPAPKGTR